MSVKMRIVVIGGTGLIGAKTVALLKNAGHDVVAASTRSGINALTGEGLESALEGAQVVIDTSNIMSFDLAEVKHFFETSSTNLLNAEKKAGVRHHVVLSIVGVQALAANPYLAGKVVQEDVVKRSGQPYTIVRATQFHEFISTLVDAYTVDGVARVPDIMFQPIAADDVAAALVVAALSQPINETVDIAGPELKPLSTFISKYLEAHGDKRDVVADPSIGYFGAPVSEKSLVPSGEVRVGTTTLASSLSTANEKVA